MEEKSRGKPRKEEIVPKKTKNPTSMPKRWTVGGEISRVFSAIDKAMAKTRGNEGTTQTSKKKRPQER